MKLIKIFCERTMLIVLFYELQILLASGYLLEVPESGERSQKGARNVADGR